MKKILLFTSLALIGILFSTCDRKEEDKQPVACFSFSPSNPVVNELIAFDNCSTDAEIYSWNFGDGSATSSDESPSHKYTTAGQYSVTLKAWYKNNVDEKTQIITVTGGGNLDPTVYDLGEVYSEYYLNDFSSTGDWAEETTADYSAAISGGVYTITNTSTTSYYTFWTNTIGMPTSSLNYDIDVYFKVGYDTDGYGDGIFWALDPDNFDYYFYRFTPYEGKGYYIFGELESDIWSYWSGSGEVNWVEGGYPTNYNLLTVRKYNNNYYFFLNEQHISTDEYFGDFGQKFGFWVGSQSQMIIEYISIYTINSKKSAQPKNFVNTPRTKGTGVVAKGLQPSSSVKNTK